MTANRQATVLLVVVGFILLLATLGTAFLTAMGERRGAALNISIGQRVRAFAEHNRTRIIGQLAREAAATPAITSYASEWYQAHMEVDPAGDPVWSSSMASESDPEVNVPFAEPLWQIQSSHWFNLQNRSRWPIEQFLENRLNAPNRWVYGVWLDEDLLPLADQSMPGARERARYALRYAAQVLDNNGLLRAVPDHPQVDPADRTAWLRYQNYTNRFARSLRSMAGTFEDSLTFFPSDPERVPSLPGSYDTPWATPSATITVRNDLPLGEGQDPTRRLEALFRGTGLISHEDEGFLHLWMPTGAYTARRLATAVNRGTHTHQAGRTIDTHFLGYAPGLRGPGIGGTDPVTTPWQINLLTASPNALRACVFGLLSHMRTQGNFDVLGKGYPEPFPLGLEEGRYVPLQGPSDDFEDWGNERFSGASFGIETSWPWRLTPPTSIRLGYMMDVATALDLAIAEARVLFNERIPASVFDAKIPLSELDPTAGDGATITRDLVREMLRILGEPDIRQRAGDSHASSIGGLLSGAVIDVGLGPDAEIHYWNDRAGSWKRRYQSQPGVLAPGADSRALEYALNDFCISLFGFANPDWRPGQSDLQRAVDFNDDGMVESTLTGWWDGSQTVWSWWWDGLGPTEYLDPDLRDGVLDAGVPEWMLQPTWYRFRGGQLLRWTGADWVLISGSDLSLFELYNSPWLHTARAGSAARPGRTGATPIRSFSATGRLFVGLSRSFTILQRSELYDLNARAALHREDRYSIYHRDPDGDGRFDDAYMSLSQVLDVDL